RQLDAVGVDAVLAVGRPGAREGDLGGVHATTLPMVPPLVVDPVRGYSAGVRLLGATLASVVLVVVAAACASDDDTGAGAPLPPIITTTTVPTTIASTTTQPRFYKIQQGDTLGKIAAAFG